MNLQKLKKIQQIAWYALIASLPFTSTPFVKEMLGSDSVASPAIPFLFILILLWLCNLFSTEKLLISRSALPLMLFCGVALIGSLISFFIKTPLFKDFGQVGPVVSAAATLMIGLLFFLVASSFLIEEKVKKTTLKVMNWSGFIILVWCAFQAFAWYATNHYPQWMFNVQGVVSARVLFRQRVTGFALEPSWLAHQLNMFYLPFWLSATLQNYSSHAFRIRKATFENFLFFGGVAALGLTLSRVGFASFLCMGMLAIFLVHQKLVTKIFLRIRRTADGFKLSKKSLSLGFIFFYILVIVLTIFVYTRIDPRMANLFTISLDQDNPLLRYFNQLKFGDRIIYWLTGWNIFNSYPVFGVGLGKAGFYFPENIPAFGWSLLEVRRLIYRSHILLNVKSLWFRLLAETGIVGFSLFLAWLISLVKPYIKKFKSAEPLERSLGLAGSFVLLGIVFEGLSIDSFAMPYWWISLGLAGSAYESQITSQRQI